MIACQELSKDVGTAAACKSMDIARPTYYRRLGAGDEKAASRPAPPRSLSAAERQEVLNVLHTERFVDKAPAEVYATLLDERVYHCSVRTMYRVLEEAGEVRERRDQATASALQGTGAPGHRTQSGLVVGYHETARAG